MERGGRGLPSMKDYYHAVQMKALLCWCNPSHVAQWKNIECEMTTVHIQAMVSDKKTIHRQPGKSVGEIGSKGVENSNKSI